MGVENKQLKQCLSMKSLLVDLFRYIMERAGELNKGRIPMLGQYLVCSLRINSGSEGCNEYLCRLSALALTVLQKYLGANMLQLTQNGGRLSYVQCMVQCGASVDMDPQSKCPCDF